MNLELKIIITRPSSRRDTENKKKQTSINNLYDNVQ
jgi:hypothetical protein